MLPRHFSLIFCVVLLAWADPPGAVKMHRLADQLQRHHKARFQLSERDLNEYLAWSLADEPRPGLHSLRLALQEGNRAQAFAVVDLDEVNRARPDLIPRLLKPLLHGQHPVTLEARFQAERGLLTYTMEKISFEDIPVPPSLAQKVIDTVAARQPEPIDLSKPWPLPNGLQRLWTRPQALLGEK